MGRRRGNLIEAHTASLKYVLNLHCMDHDTITDFQIGTRSRLTRVLIRRSVDENDLNGLFVCGLDGDRFIGQAVMVPMTWIMPSWALVTSERQINTRTGTTTRRFMVYSFPWW